MYQNARTLERSFNALQCRALDAVTGHGQMAMVKLAMDEQLDAALAYHALVVNGRPVRQRWLASLVRWLRVRLARPGNEPEHAVRPALSAPPRGVAGGSYPRA
jgi:hypothetical protein